MFKVFANQTALTAEDVNDYLMEQTVMTFANATERTNLVPNPNPGMHCHLLSTKRTYFYDSVNGWIELLPGQVSGLTARSVLVCTSTTRPSHAAGRHIYETDTGAVGVSDGTTWLFRDTKIQTYTPTLLNNTMQIGANGTLKGEYKRNGKTTWIKITMVFGVGGSVGNASYRYPLPPNMAWTTGLSEYQQIPAVVVMTGYHSAACYGYPFNTTHMGVYIPTGVQTMTELSFASPGYATQGSTIIIQGEALAS